jgi:hypothetical protein
VADLCRRVARSGLTYFEDDFRGAIQFNVRRSRRDTCNGVKGTFIDPLNKWQPTDFPPYYRSTARGYAQDDYLLEDGGVRIWRDVEFRFVKWASTCQRLAKLELESTRRQGSGVSRSSCRDTWLRLRT